MNFELINCSPVKVNALVDGKVIECRVDGPTIIKGKNVDIFLPEYKNKDRSNLWNNFTIPCNYIKRMIQEWKVTDIFFPLSGKLGCGDYINFRIFAKGKDELSPYLVICFIAGSDIKTLSVEH